MTAAIEPGPAASPSSREVIRGAVVRFCGDSGDGMQVTGDQYTAAAALARNDLATFPDFPAEIRAPAGSTYGVSGFQVHLSSQDVFTPGDAPDVLVAMNPAALKTNLRDLKKRLRVAVTEKDSEIDDYMARFQMREGRQQMLQESLRLELDAIVKAYALTTSEVWDEAASLLRKAAGALRPGGRLCLELLDPAHVDKQDNTWWFTDDTGLWGDRPFLHLGERHWDAAERASVERYYILDLQSGSLDEINLCDQTYEPGEMAGLLHAAGFKWVRSYPAWDGLPLYDAAEWVVYVAQK